MVNQSPGDLLSNLYFMQLKIWVACWIVSDVIFLAFVSTVYLAFQSHLYRYAYFKSIICTVLLAINFLFLGYGAFILVKMSELIDAGLLSNTE